jgi:ankyrin repeat protein
MIEKNPSAVCVHDRDGYTPLHRAAYNDHPAVVARLLQMQADPSARTEDGWTPLHCAACWANPQVAQVLLADPRVNVNARTNGLLTPLHLAVACTTATPGWSGDSFTRTHICQSVFNKPCRCC